MTMLLKMVLKILVAFFPRLIVHEVFLAYRYDVVKGDLSGPWAGMGPVATASGGKTTNNLGFL